MRVLFIEHLFPLNVAAWRLNEARAFIERYDTDFFSGFRAPSGANKAFDWDSMYTSHHLDRYDILIFNPRWNHVNAYQNRSGFDGTRFNGKKPGEYVVRLKKFRHEPFSLASYDCFYSLFLDRAWTFNALWPPQERPPPARQVVKAFPGGGHMAFPGGGNIPASLFLASTTSPSTTLSAAEFATRTAATLGRAVRCCTTEGKDGASLRNFVPIFRELLGLKHSQLHIITTQAHTRDYLRRVFPDTPHSFSLGGAFFDELKPVGWHRRGKINVCFTSIGNAKEKGAHIYFQLVDQFRAKYPRDNVTFHSIGGVPAHPGVKHVARMPQPRLDDFYQALPIDVIANLETAPGINGWPLGVEALAHGAALISTDSMDMNSRNGLNWGDEFTKVSRDSDSGKFVLDLAVARLHEYAVNRRLLYSHALKMQHNLEVHLSTRKHMAGIFEHLDKHFS